MNTKGFLKEMVSEVDRNGQSHISSKRVVGLMLSLVSMACIIYLTVKDGGTIVVENLIQTSLVMGASLLGISSVTSIWKNGSISVGEQPQEPKVEKKTTIKQQTITCPYHTEKGTE